MNVKNIAKKFIICIILVFLTGFSSGENPISNDIITVDEYEIRLTLHVPQVLNNTESKGKRVFKTQGIKGTVYVLWLADGSVEYLLGDDLVNRSFKVGGKNVTYTGKMDGSIVYPRYCYIGNNKTEVFTTPTLAVSLILEPSYAIGGVDEDNSFYLVLAGKGQSKLKKGERIASFITGYVAGTQGCGCYAYGHLSPTRKAGIVGPTTEASDVVATFGRFILRHKSRIKE